MKAKVEIPDEISEMDASHVNRWIGHEIGRMLRVSVTNITNNYVIPKLFINCIVCFYVQVAEKNWSTGNFPFSC